MAAVRTTCPYCGVGCGVLAIPDGRGGAEIAGDPEHPANFGRLCSKGSALGETLSLDDRLLYPEIDGARVSWNAALDRVAERFGRFIAESGPDSVAFYVSGQLLTEDYYVANKLMKGFIGSGNIDTNSRLCMASAVAGHVRAFGVDGVPGCYEDLEAADLVVLVGANAAWCHPVLFQRMKPERLVVIDPRATATGAEAALHLPLAPGSDAMLFNGLLVHLADVGALDAAYIAAHTQGFEAALAEARASAPSIDVVAAACDLDPALVAGFFALVAGTRRWVTAFGMGVNQSSSGTDKVNAIINCHLATGRIGRPGMGPFSLTGQPNAMGGREVGGLATMLAAHMGFDQADRVGRFWGSDRIATKPGLKAVDLIQAVGDRRVRGLLVMGTNPAVSLPDGSAVRAALAGAEFLAVADIVTGSETIGFAHVRLPALGWGEKDGTVTNSERRVSRQRAFLPAPGEARPDWWILAELGRRLGWADAFEYRGPADIFAEHARLSGFENDDARVFDISGLAGADYDALQPIQWPVSRPGDAGRRRLFDTGRFATPDGRARFVAVTPRPPAAKLDAAFPLALNTGRVRDHWHTMTRTGKAPTLARHATEPFVEIHPGDAGALDEGDLVRVTSRLGSLVARVVITDRQRRGEVFVPMHWGASVARDAGVASLLAPVSDPISGQPELKHAAVSLTPVPIGWNATVISAEPIAMPPTDYAARVRHARGWRWELAHPLPPPGWSEDWRGWVRALIGATGEWIELEDDVHERRDAVIVRHGRVAAIVQSWLSKAAPDRAWMEGRIGEPISSGLLAGRFAGPANPEGRIVCACFSIGTARLQRFMTDPARRSVDAIKASLRAGSNCGSCLPEIRGMLRISVAGG